MYKRQVENRNILNHIVGIDLGVNYLAVSFDDEGNTRFFYGRAIKEKRAKALALRKRLQAWDKISKVETEEAP